VRFTLPQLLNQTIFFELVTAVFINTGFLQIRNSKPKYLSKIQFNRKIILPPFLPMFNFTEIRDCQMLNTNYP
jgi:hypothetical protein